MLAVDAAWKVFVDKVQRLRLHYFRIFPSVPPPQNFRIARSVPPPRLIALTDESAAIGLVVDSFQRNHAVVKLLNG